MAGYRNSRFVRFFTRKKFPNAFDICFGVACICLVLIVARSGQWRGLFIGISITLVAAVVRSISRSKYPATGKWIDHAFWTAIAVLTIAATIIMVKAIFFTGEFVTWEFMFGFFVVIQSQLAGIYYRLGQVSASLRKKK